MCFLFELFYQVSDGPMGLLFVPLTIFHSFEDVIITDEVQHTRSHGH